MALSIPLTLRTIKGSKLSFAELDGNFLTLRSAINSVSNSDTFVTGGTYNPSTIELNFVGNTDFDPFSVDVSGLLDTYVSGGIYDPGTGCVTFTTTSGYTFEVCGFLTGSTLWEEGSAGNYSLKTINDSTTDATGDYAVAQGFNTTASGNYSHAEGKDTTASGDYSHAESSSLASGYGSHSEGGFGFSFGLVKSPSSATTYSSHAEGYGTLASGIASHAEGINTTASQWGSHAEGSNTTASGAQSHAEGLLSTASGRYSHAEGWDTTASGYQGSHSEGTFTIAGGKASHSEGRDTTASGDYSHAEGSGTTASGISSHSEGHGSQATGTTSHAEGQLTMASGGYSHAEGQNTTASGIASHSEGKDTTSSGIYSHAEGLNTTAIGIASHAEGKDTTATGNYSHAQGEGTIASGGGAHSEGSNTAASGNYTHAEGYNTTASGNYSHAQGFNTTASGNYSHAQGFNTVASGSYSYAGGSGSRASGTTSFVYSTNSLVTGVRSVVLGGQNITGSTSDTVYVPNLNIGTVGGGTSVINLGLDSNGFVVTGTTSSGGAGTIVTGFTYSNNNFTIQQSGGEPDLITNISTVTGLTINGDLDVYGQTVMSGSGQNILTLVGSGDTQPIFVIQGSSGELFSVTDSLVGSLFSVNDVSGLPILEVLDDNTVYMGSYQAPSLNTTKKLNPGIGLSTVYSLSVSAYTGAFFDYTVSNTTGARAGNIMTIFSGSTVEFTELSTNNIGSTIPITFTVSSDGLNASLQVSAATTGWEIKTIIRGI